MKVLVACESSGRVRDAFLHAGHEAISCDLLPTKTPGPHFQGDVLDIIADGWDLLIAHPPCTYLCSSGLHWNKRRPGRDCRTEMALGFVRALMVAPVPRYAIENPVGKIGTAIRPADQMIQPYQFGDDASKATCLWLKGLPLLRPTGYAPPPKCIGSRRPARRSRVAALVESNRQRAERAAAVGGPLGQTQRDLRRNRAGDGRTMGSTEGGRMNDLHTCRSCRHWSATGYDERYSPGSCAIGAWVKSWTPGIGYGLSPFPDYPRLCAGWVAAT